MAIKAYYLGRWSVHISEVEFARETEHFYYEADGTRRRKHNSCGTYHKTLEGAQKSLQTRLDRQLEVRRADRLANDAPDLLNALVDLQKVVDMLMPGATLISIPDYQLLNDAQMTARALIVKHSEVKS